VTLMSDGNRIYAAQSPEDIIDLLQKGQGVFAIALDRVWEDLTKQLPKGRAPAHLTLAGAGGA
jgi:hypothetical protein